MEFFPPGSKFDFLQYRVRFLGVSTSLLVISLVSFVFPGPIFGIDFKGGTEVELQMKGAISTSELRTAVAEIGFGQPEVIAVEGRPNRFIVRMAEVSALPDAEVKKALASTKAELSGVEVDEFRVSPGGDKVSLRLSEQADPARIESALERAGIRVRSVTPFGQSNDHRYEALLFGVGDEVVSGLSKKLGDRAPEAPLRVEWVGPKAGAQLRDAAIKSILYAIAFIMVYVAFRFDLRFAPGGVIALLHDAVITLGVFVLMRKEITLSTIAAVLTVIGYSINDTIVVYDRIRENSQRMRDASLYDVINVSTNQTMSRTVITSGTTMLAITGFFVWGTPVVKDLVTALAVGFIIGTYSSIYVAGTLTEWLDRRVFRRA